jgi:hypothetical protein
VKITSSAAVLHRLHETDTGRIYATRELHYSSLFESVTIELGYSEAEAQSRISSARLLREMPEIELEG